MEGERVADPIAADHGVSIAPDEVVQFTQAIVRQPSVTGQEGELGRFLAQRLEQFGLRVELQEVAAERCNVLATLPGDDPAL